MDTNISHEELMNQIVEYLQSASKKDLLFILAFLNHH